MKMKFKKSYLILIVPLLAVVVFFTLQFINIDFGPEGKSLNNTVFAEQQDPNLEVMEHVSPKIAQTNVDFNLVVPETQIGLNKPITNIAKPPTGAVTDEKAARALTRIESYYVSEESNDEGISIVQANNEIIQLDINGEPLESQIIKINEVEINSYSCDCKPTDITILWWYDGNVTTEVKVYGKKNLEKAYNLIEDILKK